MGTFTKTHCNPSKAFLIGTFEASLPTFYLSLAMRTLSICCLGIFLSLLLLVNFCYATEEKVAEFQPGQGADATENGEAQEEKFKFLPHHKPFFKKPILKPIPKYPILKKPIPVVKKPVPKFPIKDPLAKPKLPPVFPNYP